MKLQLLATTKYILQRQMMFTKPPEILFTMSYYLFLLYAVMEKCFSSWNVILTPNLRELHFQHWNSNPLCNSILIKSSYVRVIFKSILTTHKCWTWQQIILHAHFKALGLNALFHFFFSCFSSLCLCITNYINKGAILKMLLVSQLCIIRISHTLSYRLTVLLMIH